MISFDRCKEMRIDSQRDEAMHFNLNHSLKQPEFINAECESIEIEIPISSELINDCDFQSSMNENEMNFRYHEHLEFEFMNSNFNLKRALNVEEIVQKNPVVIKRKLFKTIQDQKD